MFLLPFEKLPGWIQGFFIICGGGAMVSSAMPWTWEQFAGWAGIVFGLGVFIHDVTSPPADSTTGSPPADRPYVQNMTPDFARYNEAELRQILLRLNKERYPERAKEVSERLAAFDAQRREPDRD